jgi:hypothetical protein
MQLAKTSESHRRQILSECTLVARNEKSSGGVGWKAWALDLLRAARKHESGEQSSWNTTW